MVDDDKVVIRVGAKVGSQYSKLSEYGWKEVNVSEIHVPNCG